VQRNKLSFGDPIDQRTGTVRETNSMPSMTKEQAIQQLKALQAKEDEAAVEKAVTVLCDFLIGLGYTDVVEEFDKV
jgi:hypothetical protein